MDFILAQISTSMWPKFFAAVAGGVGLLGVGGAFMAYTSTRRDRDSIKSAESTLTPSESWEGVHTHSQHKLSEWMQERGIDTESGVADVIRACWSAWLGSRATTLTELHVLVARRERSKVPSRLSAGIATLLLVIGIVGTLSSVKPILNAFQFRISTPEDVVPATDDPALSNVADSTEMVNSLMHSLGDAFLPSLVALVATIVVVVFRGVYSLSLNRYTLELDRFAMGMVLPHFRPRSIAEEYENVRGVFGTLAKTIGEREEKFELIVAQLTKFADNVKSAMSGLDIGVAKMSSAADALASKSNSIATTLTRTLGKKSPLYAAVNGFEGIFTRTNEELDRLSEHIDGASKSQDQTRHQMLSALDQLAKTIETIGHDHKQDRQAVSSAIADLKALMAVLPNQAVEATHEVFKGAMEKMKSSLATLTNEQKTEMANTQRDLRDKSTEAIKSIRETLNETTIAIAESTKGIPEALGRLNDSLNQKSETEKAAAEAIRSVANEAMSRITNGRTGWGRPSSAPVVSDQSVPASPLPLRGGEENWESAPASRLDLESLKEIQVSERSAPPAGADSVFPETPSSNHPWPRQADPPLVNSTEEAEKPGFFKRIFRKS